MTTNQLSLLPLRSVTEFFENIKELSEEIKSFYLQDEIPFVVGWSGGKDSTATLQLIWYSIAELPVEKRQKPIYVMTTDTLVENPIISTWVKHSIKRMKEAAIKQKMPVKPYLLYPELKERFWICLIGKGYPAPRNRFRWCTDRLKIQPSNRFIRNVVRANGEAILILGTRKAESSKRAATMEKYHTNRQRDRINSNNASLPNSWIYSPIEDWRNDEVWIYLMQFKNPWGNNNDDLLSLYQGATEDNECPLVVDSSTPSCGGSRFGCWVCTMVSKDKSMAAMIQNDAEKEWMKPLLDIRNTLELKNDRERRDFRRIHGNVELFGQETVEPIPGPYTKKWREHWLKRVLEAQVQIRETAPPEMRDIILITPEELSEIRRIWLEEKHEFDDRLPQIYEEVTGEPFQDINKTSQTDTPLLGADEWSLLKNLSEGDEMHLELTTRLLDIERQYYTKSKRSGIISDLEKCFDTSSRSQQEAIQNAYYQRDIQDAIEKADVSTLQQLTRPETVDKEPESANNEPSPKPKKQTWGELKFPSQSPIDN